MFYFSSAIRQPEQIQRTQQTKVLQTKVGLAKNRVLNLRVHSWILRSSRLLLSFLFARSRFIQLDAGKILFHNKMLYVCTLAWFLLYGWMAWRLWRQPERTLESATLWLSAICVVLGVYVVLGWRSTAANWLARFDWLRRINWFGRSGQRDKWRPLTRAEMSVMDPGDFEAYIAERIFAPMGYKVLDTPNVKDGGVDILLEDEYGAQSIVQCKRYSSTVGTPVVRDLYGAMIHSGAVQGFLVTSGRISEDAHKWVQDKPIGLIDGAEVERLARELDSP